MSFDIFSHLPLRFRYHLITTYLFVFNISEDKPHCYSFIANACRAPVFAGKDASRALGKTSTKAEDVRSDWQDLDDKEKSTLNDWITFFSKRYNVVGKVEGATNME